MINSTNTVNIDGAQFKDFDVKNAFNLDQNDGFTRWVVRPLAILAAIGLGVAVFFTSAMLIMISLALLPILAVALWAMRTKLERDLKDANADGGVVIDAEESTNENGQPVK